MKPKIKHKYRFDFVVQKLKLSYVCITNISSNYINVFPTDIYIYICISDIYTYIFIECSRDNNSKKNNNILSQQQTR